MQKPLFKSSLHRNQVIMGYVLIIPALLFFFVFFGYSLVQAFHYSTLDWDGVTEQTYVGMQNYIDLVHDSVFWKAFTNNYPPFVYLLHASIQQHEQKYNRSVHIIRLQGNSNFPDSRNLQPLAYL